MEKENASVRVTISRTLNLGNYENIKIEIGETLPAQPTDEDPYCKTQIECIADTLLAICKQKGKEYKRLLKPIKKV